jgi:hypothetical protein
MAVLRVIQECYPLEISMNNAPAHFLTALIVGDAASDEG